MSVLMLHTKPDSSIWNWKREKSLNLAKRLNEDYFVIKHVGILFLLFFLFSSPPKGLACFNCVIHFLRLVWLGREISGNCLIQTAEILKTEKLLNRMMKWALQHALVGMISWRNVRNWDTYQIFIATSSNLFVLLDLQSQGIQ